MRPKKKKFLALCAVIILFFGVYQNFKEREEIKLSEEEYENILPISENSDFIKRNKLFIYRNGADRVETKYEEIKKISSEYLLVKVGDEIKLIDKENTEKYLPANDEIVSISQERYVLLKNGENYFYYDLNDERIIGKSYKKLGTFQDDRAYFVEDNKIGFINTEGVEIIDNQFDLAGAFQSGYAIIGLKNGRYAYISKNGMISDETFDFIKIFEDEEMIMKDGKHNILKTKTDKIKSEDKILYLAKGFYLFLSENSMKVFSVEKRKFIKISSGEYLGTSDEVIFYKNNDKNYIYNMRTEKEKAINPEIKEFEIYLKNQIVGREKNSEKSYLFNGKHKKISKGYDFILPMVYGKMIVGSEDGYGIINSSGKEILKCQYDSINLTPKYIIAEKNGNKNLYDNSGKELLKGYKDIIYQDGNIYVSDSGKWRYLYTEKIKFKFKI